MIKLRARFLPPQFAAFILLVAAAFGWSAPAAADPVFVESAESGQAGAGYTVSNGSSCYLVTPLHVIWPKVEGEDGVYDETNLRFTVTDARGIRATGELRTPYRDFDLALGEIPNPGPLLCPKQWSDGRALPQALRPRMALTVTQVGPSRSVKAVGATLRELQGDAYLEIEPARANDTFAKGASGSLVEANGQPVGILLEVDPGTKLGRVLRQNQIHALVGAIVMEPREGRQTMAVAPFVYGRTTVESGTAATLKAINSNPRFRAIALAPGAKHNGITVQGTLVTMVRGTAPNPNYVRPTQRGSLPNLLGIGRKKGADTVSRSLVTVSFEISWKFVATDGTIVFQDVDRRAKTIGQNFFQRGVTDAQMADESISESIVAMLAKMP